MLTLQLFKSPQSVSHLKFCISGGGPNYIPLVMAIFSSTWYICISITSPDCLGSLGGVSFVLFPSQTSVSNLLPLIGSSGCRWHIFPCGAIYWTILMPVMDSFFFLLLLWGLYGSNILKSAYRQ